MLTIVERDAVNLLRFFDELPDPRSTVRGMAIALSVDLLPSMQMAGWLHWRIYETRFSRRDFQSRFGRDLDRVYGRYLKPLRLLGFLRDDGDQIVLTDKGS
jgi:hypothetical protein